MSNQYHACSLLIQTINRGFEGFCDHKKVIIFSACLLMLETMLLDDLQTWNTLGTHINSSYIKLLTNLSIYEWWIAEIQVFYVIQEVDVAWLCLWPFISSSNCVTSENPISKNLSLFSNCKATFNNSKTYPQLSTYK